MNTPEIGSKWDIGRPVQVIAIKKRGRGYQVHYGKLDAEGYEEVPGHSRLRDFLKAAKPL